MNDTAPAARAAPREIRRVTRECCPVCGNMGRPLAHALVDRWFGVPGTWSMRQCTAGDCGTHYLDPMPHPEDLALLYQRYYTHEPGAVMRDVLGTGSMRRARLAYLSLRYGYRIVPAPPAILGGLFALLAGRREHLDLSVLRLRAAWRGPLLDVGCGSGTMLALMSELGWDAEGIDLAAEAVAVAQAAGLRARVATLADTALPERHYAAVTSSHVIEHVEDPLAFLQGCLRVTRPGGRLALTTPNARSLGAHVFGSRWRGLEPPRHLQVLTAAALARLTRQAGYEDVRVTTSARLAASIARETWRPETAERAGYLRASLPLRMAAGAFQMLERAGIVLAPFSGEELLLEARAPGAES